ncbi:MAG: ATP-dependent helicase HrpB [Paracoccaceae bacterium]|nr:ATP-dependent helicase HrpB [Paracoccaceae bacterium]
MTRLPIDDVMPDLLGALGRTGMAVLAAPPGAGKTTRVPLALLDAGLAEGRILVLEPRRLAARAAAERMAETVGERVGETVGYRIRGETRVGRATRIEVITEGILTRMFLSDPELAGIGAVLFDEVHERSIHSDLGLALALETREALREDLILLPMSATIDTAAFAALIGGAPEVVSEGRRYPVDIRWRETPLPRAARIETSVAKTVREVLRTTAGGVLVFLPGEGEIRRTAAALRGDLPEDTVLRPLYGALPFRDQQAAIRPEPGARKIVLATAIAETSLTIEDVRVVVDAGLARRARVDPGSGMTRLVTEKATRAEADQRAGRAGRVAPGVAFRLWTKGEEGGLPAQAPAEIETADLTGFALALAAWGARDPTALKLATAPPRRALSEAQALLCDLGAIGPDGAITAHGRRLAALPLHPRLGQMLLRGGRDAAPLAALLGSRDPMRGAGVDLALRLRALRDGSQTDRALADIRAEAARLRALAGSKPHLSPGALTALAYPDRVALRRSGQDARYLLSGGRGVRVPAGDPLAAAPLIVVADTDGAQPEATVRLAAEISERDLRALFPDRIETVETARWSARTNRVEARRQERLGAVALTDLPWTDASDTALRRAMLDGVRALGLGLSERAARLCRRAELARAAGADLPAMDEASLLAEADDWLLPFLGGLRTAADWARFDAEEALKARLGWAGRAAVDRIAPGEWRTPLGRKVAVDYAANVPEVAVRLQEVFGLTAHPEIAGRPLRLTLLSPAGRPLQVTTDLPGFWARSYTDVRKEMRGRYPKHPWPEDPIAAAPTLRAKPKGG